ncbi:aspartate kinase [Clostridium sp. SYSU_GA19001]|uniref:aspartate kinase n=1 Tax=Clostridium caldaquaticum TaxID=2940653 RepID=UPI00207731E4|nr:aspartate kinase [Clostridium caldaquaticum]MCM8709795.1 aspartate kinase [Clostridium caldaquaticum]
MKGIIVQKYGGTSVGSIERINNVAKRIIAAKNNGKKVIAVVSAMGDTTDDLIEKTKQITPNPSPRELDMLLSTGEQVSISLLAMAIQAQGHKAISLTGSQCGVFTNGNYKSARIEKIDKTRIEKELEEGNIVVVAGFQGISDNGDVTTLGRGGSDTSAVALAAAVEAELCEIYTDVDGVYTTDPRVVPKAKLMDKVAYDEMLELARLGAKVLHPRSVEIARRYKVPLVVRSSFNDKPGTKIMGVEAMEKAVVRGITLDDNIAKVSVLKVPDKPGIAFKLFSHLASNNIGVDMIIQNVNTNEVNDISFTVAKDDLNHAIQVLGNVMTEIGADKVVYDSSVVKLSVVGSSILGDPDIVSGFFECLYELGINVQMISTSELKISCIIDQEKANEALQSLHSKFSLDADEEIELNVV